MRRLLTSLAMAALLTSGIAVAARADDAANKAPAVETAPSDGKAGEMPAGCMEGGGCCGAPECKGSGVAKGAAPEAKAAAEEGGCPCMRNKHKPAS